VTTAVAKTIILPAAGVYGSTVVAEKKLFTPKELVLFYGSIMKSCYTATGSKRLACATAGVSCIIAVIPGPHQNGFIIACAAAARGANKL
jgi:hypothetical protein